MCRPILPVPDLEIEVKFYGGSSLYYPLMAVWLEDEQGGYIQTLFVPKGHCHGYLQIRIDASGKWVEAAKRAPQTLPYWSHKRGIRASDGLYMPEPENPVPDAYSGATPVTSFTLTARADGPLPEKFRVMFEINQNWDWNEYWTNDKYPGTTKTTLIQHSRLLSMRALSIRKSFSDRYIMKPIGHSHPDRSTPANCSQTSAL